MTGKTTVSAELVRMGGEQRKMRKRDIWWDNKTLSWDSGQQEDAALVIER